MYTFEKFKQSTWSLVVLADNKVVFRSRARGLTPLRKLVNSNFSSDRRLTIYDKYVGCAAALLMALLKPSGVFTPVVSEAGKATLTRYNIPLVAEREVKYLMGIASDEMCGWEKMSIGKTPEEFLALLEK